MDPADTRNSDLTPDLVVGQQSAGTTAPAGPLAPMLRELDDLASGPERDEHGLLRPTPHAQQTAKSLLQKAAQLGSQPAPVMPRGCVSADSVGGVRIEWVRDAASVFLVVPSSSTESPYIYHEVGDDYGTEDASPDRLAKWLRNVA